MSTGGEDQPFKFLLQVSLTKRISVENVLYLILSSQNGLVDNDHHQINFDINVKSESKIKKIQEKLPQR